MVALVMIASPAVSAMIRLMAAPAGTRSTIRTSPPAPRSRLSSRPTDRRSTPRPAATMPMSCIISRCSSSARAPILSICRPARHRPASWSMVLRVSQIPSSAQWLPIRFSAAAITTPSRRAVVAIRSTAGMASTPSILAKPSRVVLRRSIRHP